MKRYLFIVMVLFVSAVFYFAPSPFGGESSDEPDVYQASEGELLIPQRNVAIAVLDLADAGLDFTDPEDIETIRLLHNDFVELDGVGKVDSILSASRVISRGDDIVVSRAIPAEKKELSAELLERLLSEIPDFPELSPYINESHDTLLFYIYFSNKISSLDIHTQIKEVQEKWQEELPFDFTGKGPILAETEDLLTKDIVLFFPILAIMVIAVFSLFRSVKVCLISLFLILLSVTAAYGFIRFTGIPDSALVLLIPVFSLGLLSDYLIHYFYHVFYTPGAHNPEGLKRILRFPLSLTALSTLTGFLSLSLINGSGHLQLGLIIAVAVAVTWGGVFFWLDFTKKIPHKPEMFHGFQRFQGKFFVWLASHRFIYFVLIGVAILWGLFHLPQLSIEPYPIQQLPEHNTIKKADTAINNEFYGTLPFFIEVDTGEKNGILKKESVLAMNRIHTLFEESQSGYAFSLLSVMKRMNFYFMGSEDSFLTTNEFDDFYDALIEQYLLYYSSSVDPLDYESLLDNSYRIFSINGLCYYKDYNDLERFYQLMETIQEDLPEAWTFTVHGMVNELANEQSRLKNNWIISFLGGSLLIFITVLFFYRKLDLALISLVPGIISMIISFGIISALGISIDAFSIIFVAIITGLVIDYSIHTLMALDQIKTIESLAEGFSKILSFSGIPIFLSFLTSLLSFSVLFLSSFKGARSLGFLLFSSLILSFFLSLYLIPLIILPERLKKEKNNV